MPKFYLHLSNGTGFTEDRDGSEHADLNAAYAVAMTHLREVIAAEVKDGGLNTASFIEIEDANRELLTTLSFEDAISISDKIGQGPRQIPN